MTHVQAKPVGPICAVEIAGEHKRPGQVVKHTIQTNGRTMAGLIRSGGYADEVLQVPGAGPQVTPAG